MHSREGVSEIGSGQTIDVSSSGLRFTADRPLNPGLKLELFLDWPLMLDSDVELQLIASGVVVRTDGCETVLRIQRHNFKTRGRTVKICKNAVKLNPVWKPCNLRG